jgi:hypothetical protein
MMAVARGLPLGARQQGNANNENNPFSFLGLSEIMICAQAGAWGRQRKHLS